MDQPQKNTEISQPNGLLPQNDHSNFMNMNKNVPLTINNEHDVIKANNQTSATPDP